MGSETYSDSPAFPASHVVHVPPSGPDQPALQMQAVNDELPAREMLFVGHCKHVDGEVALTTCENVAAGHVMHSAYVSPTVPEYLPGPQSLRAVALLTKFPAGQASQALAPTTPENLPDSQSIQAKDVVEPSVCENLPNPQSTHTVDPAISENLPQTQMLQAASVLAPTVAENLPAAQLLQAVEPDVYENSPCGQSLQKPDPDACLFFPASHLIHSPSTCLFE